MVFPSKRCHFSKIGSFKMVYNHILFCGHFHLQSLKAKKQSLLKDVQVNFTTYAKAAQSGLFRSTQVGHCRLQGLGVDFDAGLCSEKSYQSCRDDGETNQACIIMILLIVFSYQRCVLEMSSIGIIGYTKACQNSCRLDNNIITKMSSAQHRIELVKKWPSSFLIMPLYSLK